MILMVVRCRVSLLASSSIKFNYPWWISPCKVLIELQPITHNLAISLLHQWIGQEWPTMKHVLFKTKIRSSSPFNNRITSLSLGKSKDTSITMSFPFFTLEIEFWIIISVFRYMIWKPHLSSCLLIGVLIPSYITLKKELYASSNNQNLNFVVSYHSPASSSVWNCAGDVQ